MTPPAAEHSQGQPIRSVQRALTLIRLMNQRDSWTLQQISIESLLPKPTAYRLLQTLITEGYAYMPPGKVGVYRLTSRIRELGAGLTSYTIFADLAEPVVIRGTRSLDWPVSFAMPDRPFMRIVSCGMPYSQPHSVKPTSVGREHWMFSSAVGAAYLSLCDEDEQEACRLAGLEYRAADGSVSEPPTAAALFLGGKVVRERGYALRIATPRDANSAMAVPVQVDGRPIGALACSTFPHSLSPEFIRRVLPSLISVADELAATCRDAKIHSD